MRCAVVCDIVGFRVGGEPAVVEAADGSSAADRRRRFRRRRSCSCCSRRCAPAINGTGSPRFKLFFTLVRAHGSGLYGAEAPCLFKLVRAHRSGPYGDEAPCLFKLRAHGAKRHR